MVNIAVVSWNLGNLPTNAFESLILDEYESEIIRKELADQFNGIYYLQTCQRIIYVISVADDHSTRLFIKNLYRRLGIEQFSFPPDVYLGLDALIHLSEVVSGLESIVIGEDQIQGQVKQAFISCENTMNSELVTIFQHLLRIGKKVREESLLAKGKVSTIELAHNQFRNYFNNTSNIGILGTGKYARDIYSYLNIHGYDLDVYTTTEERVGEDFMGTSIKHFKDMGSHEILVTVTNHHQLIDAPYVSEKFNDDILILDFGMPRNCNRDISKLPEIIYYDLEKLVKLSRNDRNHQVIDSAMQIIEAEVKKLLERKKKKERSDAIVSLRQDLHQIAQKEKNKFVDQDFDEKDFDQFVNRLIHISQQHVEKQLFKGI